MNTWQKLTFAIASITFAALQPVRATAQGASAPVGLHHSQAVQPAAERANKASQEANAKPVMSKLLPDLPGKEVVILTVTYPPGHAGAVHRHNANGFIYVLEGSVVMGVRGDAPVTLGPGQTFYENPNDIHTIGRNPSRTTPAKFLVFLIKDKDAPISIPVE
jgi:quercetin dioxygenase-like cupin family protein